MGIKKLPSVRGVLLLLAGSSTQEISVIVRTQLMSKKMLYTKLNCKAVAIYWVINISDADH